MNLQKNRLMVFCKAPKPGMVKTRLASTLNAKGLDGEKIAAKIHEYLAIECLQKVTQDQSFSVELWCAPDTKHPFFKRCKEKYGVELKEQGKGDLGDRMFRAFDDALSTHPYAVVIGTDCPAITNSYVTQAFQSMRDTNNSSVLGPAEDGGYMLLGLSRMQREIFSKITWGTSRVYEETIEKLEGEVKVLTQLWDVDLLDDLARLISEAKKLNLEKEFIQYLMAIEIPDSLETEKL